MINLAEAARDEPALHSITKLQAALLQRENLKHQ